MSKIHSAISLFLLMFVASPLMAVGNALTADGSGSAKPCVFGVFPFISTQRLERVFAPIAATLDKVLDCSLIYRSASSFERFTSRLENRKYVLAFVQPFDYVKIAEQKGYRPLAVRNEDLYAVVVTGLDTAINHVSDLKDGAISLPPVNSAISYLGRELLKQAGLHRNENVTLIYSKDHFSCMHKLVIGKVDACVTAPTTLRLFEKQNRVRLRVIEKSPTISNALFIVRDDIPEQTFLQLQQKIINMELNDDARKLFRKKPDSAAFRKSKPGEYERVREYCQKYQPQTDDNETRECLDSDLRNRIGQSE